jgi:hypothetical protein
MHKIWAIAFSIVLFSAIAFVSYFFFYDPNPTPRDASPPNGQDFSFSSDKFSVSGTLPEGWYTKSTARALAITDTEIALTDSSNFDGIYGLLLASSSTTPMNETLFNERIQTSLEIAQDGTAQGAKLTDPVEVAGSNFSGKSWEYTTGLSPITHSYVIELLVEKKLQITLDLTVRGSQVTDESRLSDYRKAVEALVSSLKIDIP